MKVAICISGHIRSYKKFVEQFRESIEDASIGFDFFISIWDQVNWYNEYISLFGVNLIKIKSNKIDYKDIYNTYKPLMLNINKPIDFSYLNLQKFAKSDKYFPKDNNKKRSYEGIYSQYYLVNQCLNLKLSHEKKNLFNYDLVIRTRPDFTLINKLDVKQLIDGSKDYIYLLSQKSNSNSHIKENITFTDVFIASNSSNMDKFANFYKVYPSYLKKYSNQRIEILLQKFIEEELKLKIKALSLGYKVHELTFKSKF